MKYSEAQFFGDLPITRKIDFFKIPNDGILKQVIWSVRGKGILWIPSRGINAPILHHVTVGHGA